MTAQIGVYGTGTMGRAVALNLAGNGFEVAVFNREPDLVDALFAGAGPLAARLPVKSRSRTRPKP